MEMDRSHLELGRGIATGFFSLGGIPGALLLSAAVAKALACR